MSEQQLAEQPPCRSVCPPAESFDPQYRLNPDFVEFVAERAANHWRSRRSSLEADRESLIAIAAEAILRKDNPSRILAATTPYKRAKRICWRALNDSYKAAKASRQHIAFTNESLDPKAHGLGLAQRNENYCPTQVQAGDEARQRTVWKSAALNHIHRPNLESRWEQLVEKIRRENLVAKVKFYCLTLLTQEEAVAVGCRFGIRWLGEGRGLKFREIGRKLGRTTNQAQRIVARAVRVLREGFGLEDALRYLRRNEAGEWERRDAARTDRFSVFTTLDGRLIRATPLPKEGNARPSI